MLAVVLTDKGIAALQEAGWIGSYALGTPRIDMLGIFPSAQTLLAKLAVGVVVVAAFVLNSRTPRTCRRLASRTSALARNGGQLFE